MSYLVLARKYRPQTFSDLVGQEHVAKTLVNALAGGRIAHSYVLSGPRGCGKTTTARILARALNCVQGPTITPCGVCPQCVDIAGGASTDDVLEIDGASNRGIDQIRELRETVKYAPARSRYRVIIIDEAHQISKDGFNALLKTLEEPPPHVVFMMATTESQKIPETILSRCQRFQLRSITVNDIHARLRLILDAEKIVVQEAALREVARAAHGSLRDALSLLDQVIAYAPSGATVDDVRHLLGLLPGEFVRGFSDVLLAGQPGPVLRAVQAAVDDGLDLSQLAEDLMDRRHRALLWKSGVRDGNSSEAGETGREADLLSEERLERDLGVLSKTVADMRRSESPRVTFELACLEMAQEAVSVSELVERLERLEQTLRSGSEGPRPNAAPPPLKPAPTPHPTPLPPPPSSAARQEPPLRQPSPPRLNSAAPSTNAWTADAVRSAWSLMVGEVGHKKPSLETFLHMARWSALPGNVLKLSFDQDFHKNQVAGNEPLWLGLLGAKLGAPFTVQYAVEPPPATVSSSPTLKTETRPAADATDDEETVVESAEDESASSDSVDDGSLESPETLAVLDPGVRKVLEKFPGRVRRADPHP